MSEELRPPGLGDRAGGPGAGVQRAGGRRRQGEAQSIVAGARIDLAQIAEGQEVDHVVAGPKVDQVGLEDAGHAGDGGAGRRVAQPEAVAAQLGEHQGRGPAVVIGLPVVRSRPAIDGVIAARTDQLVAAAAPVDDVAPAEAVETVIVVPAGQRIVAAAAVDDGPLEVGDGRIRAADGRDGARRLVKREADVRSVRQQLEVSKEEVGSTPAVVVHAHARVERQELHPVVARAAGHVQGLDVEQFDGDAGGVVDDLVGPSGRSRERHVQVPARGRPVGVEGVEAHAAVDGRVPVAQLDVQDVVPRPARQNGHR